uniref:DUF6571 family protein n=1 Tax=Arcanobacterium phocae TaxID=131112 RepID=UPI001C0EA721
AKVASYVAYVLKGLTEFSTAEHISRVNALLSGIQTSPQASRYMLMGLGGKGLVEKIVLADQLLSQNATHLERSGKSVVTQVQILAQSLKTIFMTGERELADYSPELSKKIARDMVGCISPFQGEVLLSNNNGNAISWLLYDAHLSTSFLTQFGDDFELADRFRTDQSYPLWCTQHPSNLSVLFPAIARKSGLDPATSFMSALKNNPQAALAFFKPGRDGEFARQEYWIQNRSWAHDGFVSILGALDVAVTSEGLRGTKEAGELTSSIIELLANRMQNKNNDGKPLKLPTEETDLISSLSPIAAVNIAHIMATYMPAVDYFHDKIDNAKGQGETLSNTEVTLTKEDIFSPAENMPQFASEDLTLLIKTISSKDNGFLALRKAVDNYHSAYLDTTLQNLPVGSENRREIFETIAKADARLEGFFVSAIGGEKIERAREADAQAKLWISLSTNLATSLLGAGEQFAVDYLADQTLDSGNSKLEEMFASNEKLMTQTWNDIAEDSLRNRKLFMIERLFVNEILRIEDLKTYIIEDKRRSAEEVNQWFSNGEFPSVKICEDFTLRNLIFSFVKNHEKFDLDAYDAFNSEFISRF